MSDQHSGPLLRPLLRSAVSSPQIAGNINSISSNSTIFLHLLFIILFVGVFPISNLDTTTSSSSSSFSSSSSPEFFRNVQVAFKRHPLGIMQGDGIKPRRMLGP
ncbi:hypothetical protein LINGRAPRIM_LOCUS2687 [Linum grandiflorum]